MLRRARGRGTFDHGSHTQEGQDGNNVVHNTPLLVPSGIPVLLLPLGISALKQKGLTLLLSCNQQLLGYLPNNQSGIFYSLCPCVIYFPLFPPSSRAMERQATSVKGPSASTQIPDASGSGSLVGYFRLARGHLSRQTCVIQDSVTKCRWYFKTDLGSIAIGVPLSST
jgi:hypothetical protein